MPVPLQEQQASADAKAAATKQPADDSEEADADSPDESAEEDVTLPSIPLTSELLYTILASDFAYQGGYWQPAYAAKMELAEKTRDPRIAKHAAEMAIKAHHIDKSLAAAKLWHELARQVGELRMEGAPLAQDLGIRPGIDNLVGGDAGELIGCNVAYAVAGGLDRVHFD